jgi:hypothetical protein
MAEGVLGEADRKLLAQYRSRSGETLSAVIAGVLGVLLVGCLIVPFVLAASAPPEGREGALRSYLPLGVGAAITLGVGLERAVQGWRLRRLVRRMADRLDAVDPSFAPPVPGRSSRPVAEVAGVLTVGVAGILIALGLIWLAPQFVR